MQLFWHGMSSIRIEAKFAEKESTLLTDPYSNETGLRFPRTLAPDLLVLSHQDRSRFAVDAVENKPFIISDPGEYEVKGLFVHGIQDPTAESEKNRQLIFRFDIEGISMAYLGQLNRALTAFEVEGLGDVDILILPVGGGETLDPKKLPDVISAVEPRLIVPISYDLPGLKTKLATVDQFCKQLGGAPREDMQKLKIAKKDLPTEDMKIVVLERA